MPETTVSHLTAGENIYIALGGGRIDVAADGSGLGNLAQPRLARFTLDDATDKHGVDLFSALRWDYGLVGSLYGRDAELKAILDWAEKPGLAATARLMSGAGGSGKTRLAGEVAWRLRDKGWTAGFVPSDVRSRPFGIKPGAGLLLILDYPEERPEETTWLLRLVADAVAAPCPIRLLLLSRRGFTAWEDQALQMEGRFGRQEVAALGPLDKNDCVSLIDEAATRFAAASARAKPNLAAASAWLDQSGDNLLPLLSAAAAVHAELEPGDGFGIGGNDIVGYLASRERRRVLGISKELGFGDEGLAWLLALAVLADGLSPAQIAELAKAGAVEGDPATAAARLAKTPWWRAGRLPRLEPDRPAAAFATSALFTDDFPRGHDRLPDWLYLALKDGAATLTDRLSRIRHDIFALDGQEAGAHPLDEALLAMLRASPDRPAAFRALAEGQASVWVAHLTAEVAVRLARQARDPAERAAALNNAAAYLSALGQLEEALAAAEEAVDLYRALARARPEAFTPDLAVSLNTLANVLSALGRREEALAAAVAGAPSGAGRRAAGRASARHPPPPPLRGPPPPLRG